MKSFLFSKNFQTENVQIKLPLLDSKDIELWIKREDLIHPEVSGNKFRKLKYNLKEAKRQKKQCLLTFGGAFSNHILATAAAAFLEDFQSIGVIRGEELGKDIQKTLETNVTLAKASEYGMKFVFLSRDVYRRKMLAETISSLRADHGDFYLIPEGGTNELAVKGCSEILTNEDERFDYICSCVGTGGTIAGIINSTKSHQKVLGYPALKGDFLNQEIQKYTGSDHNWELVSKYHFGGYAKHSEELIREMNTFKSSTSIQLDPIYTGKMVFGILDQIRNDKFPKGSKILMIHTGGLQGVKGFNQQLKNKNKPYRIDI